MSLCDDCLPECEHDYCDNCTKCHLCGIFASAPAAPAIPVNRIEPKQDPSFDYDGLVMVPAAFDERIYHRYTSRKPSRDVVSVQVH